jgi:hypothetical protein
MEILGKYIGKVGTKPFLAIRVILPNHIKSRKRWRGKALHSRLLLVTDKGSFWAPALTRLGNRIVSLPLVPSIEFTVLDVLLVDYLNLEKVRVVDFFGQVQAKLGEEIVFSYEVLTYDSLRSPAVRKV